MIPRLNPDTPNDAVPETSLQGPLLEQSTSASRYRLLGVAGLIGLVVVVAALLATKGLQRSTSLRKAGDSDASVAGEKKDPWEVAISSLRKETNFAACQLVLHTLNTRLQDDETFAKPASLTAETEKTRSGVPLSGEDRQEMQGWGYTTSDAAYLEECLYFRDVAQSLRVPNLTPSQLADLAFAWVCRSVTLNAMVLEEPGGVAPAVAIPPSYVLRRGSGSGLERMYVFLALLQQLDLDACLIGPPDAGDVGSWNVLGRNRQRLPGGPPRPFWGVGVRLDKEIQCYDPWRETVFPAPLRQLRDKPDSFKEWLNNPANLAGLVPEDLKTAQVFLAVPVNALAPRMEMLNSKIKDGVGVRLAMNPSVILEAFPDPKPTFWNPPGDRSAYGRTARYFLPRALGGTDQSATGGASRLFAAYTLEQLPSGLKSNLPELKGEEAQIANDRLFAETRLLYSQAFVEAPNPRERIQRGHFQEAIVDLISKRDAFNRSLELLRNTRDADQQISEWCLRAKKLYYQDLGGSILVQGDREAAKMAAQAAIEDLWRSPTVELMRNKVVAPICKAEALFLIGLCKHEMAERAEIRAEHASAEERARLRLDATEAWSDARNAWRTYLDNDNDFQRGLPGRMQQVRTLSGRAEKLANRPVAQP